MRWDPIFLVTSVTHFAYKRAYQGVLPCLTLTVDLTSSFGSRYYLSDVNGRGHLFSNFKGGGAYSIIQLIIPSIDHSPIWNPCIIYILYVVLTSLGGFSIYANI